MSYVRSDGQQMTRLHYCTMRKRVPGNKGSGTKKIRAGHAEKPSNARTCHRPNRLNQ